MADVNEVLRRLGLSRTTEARSLGFNVGRAIVRPCPDCKGARCSDCDYTGHVLLRACPMCGDTAFDNVAGTNGQRMVCRLGCGHRWSRDDPEWTIQRLPSAAA